MLTFFLIWQVGMGNPAALVGRVLDSKLDTDD